MLGSALGNLLSMSLGAGGSQTQNLFSLGGCANAMPAGMGSGMTGNNNPLANIAGQAGTLSGIDIYGNHIRSHGPWRLSPFPHTVFETTGMFRVQKVANGYLVDLVRHDGGTTETHYVEGFKEAGELITAHLVKWELQGEK